MERMRIGKSDVWAPKLTLGTFAMGGGSSWQDTTRDDQELIDLIRQAYDLGVRAIDTAPVYGTGRSERIIGQAVKGRREDYYLATKCSLNWRDTGGRFEYSRDGKTVCRDFSKAALIADVEDSLRRLDTDYIDMMIIHRCPELNEFGEAMEAMDALKQRGLIRSVGLSNTDWSEDAAKSVETCLQYGQLDLLQESASLLSRRRMERFLELCEKHDLTFQGYSALEKGALAGKRIENVSSWTGDNRANYKWFQPESIPKLNALNEALADIAAKYNCSVAVLCLAWVLAQSDRVNLLVGARRLSSIEDTLKALNVRLKAEDIAEMNRLSDRVHED